MEGTIARCYQCGTKAELVWKSRCCKCLIKNYEALSNENERLVQENIILAEELTDQQLQEIYNR
jgi:hypothetical protein